ncbi:CPBP family intramembrane glutamic endopeptidase [Rugosimonospora acidiphila]|uniref:CPBP family intramembrane glutamic endopeptidase n=1 Tax=Rugosimonospora acidiphila TaxID=556531 RepID=UPI0031EBE43D
MPAGRAVLRNEILLVLGVSLGYSAIYAMIEIVGRLTARQALDQQSATLNGSQAPGRPWLDLALQLAQILFAVVPALLAVHLLNRDRGDAQRILGISPRRPGRDLGAGAGLAALIGIPGLGLYLAALALGINAKVVPEALPKVWWAIPVLLLSAAQNGLLEELIVVGYLVTRLRQLGWALPAVVLTSALLRGSYHLYQGFGGFLGNAVMGVIFALFFIRFRRVLPLAIAHFLIDSVAFIGYATLHQHLSFLH